jgi:regulator of sigma E protease
MGLVSLNLIGSFALAALGLGFVVFVHELGHFLVAKLCGVKCEKFYIGFDVPIRIGPFQLPRTLFRKKWGETEYGIGIVPLGGYVKMLGQDDNPANSAKEAERIRIARDQSGTGAGSDATYQIDPRSYPAKTVLQRLAIISAGVVMNLIFAVIFGMVAYRMGVSYTPTVVGSATPGLSAWEVGLQTGDRIIQLGRDGEPSPHLRFNQDMTVKVMMTGAHKDLDLLVQRYTPPGLPAPPPEWITVTLSSPQAELYGRPMIGISQYGTTTVGTRAEVPELSHLPGNRAEPPLAPGDKIVGVDDVPVADYTQLTRELARRVDRDVMLQVERPAKGDSSESPHRFQAKLPPFPVRWVGLHLTMGPITSVQHGSVAQLAGFQEGDRLVAVNGQPIVDPMRLPDVVAGLVGQPVQIQVERPGSDQPVTLNVTPVEPSMLHVGAGPERPVPIESLGIAYAVTNTVASVAPGSAAEAGGIQPGDVLQTAEFVPASPEDVKREAKIFGPAKPIRLGEEKLVWPRVQDRIQDSLPATRVKLTYQRGDRLHEAEMLPEAAENWFDPDRRLMLTSLQEVHQTDSWATAFRLGWRETVEAMQQVYFVLFRLVTGQLSVMNLGGPATIATMAGFEASESLARLLVFLTLLSANLAVVNFLPIPVLDGGHAMFLLYEGIFRKPVNERVALGLTMVGFCFVLGLMLFVLGLDVWRFSGFAG